MDLTIHASFLPHEDPVASLAFWRDALGFEVHDVGSGGLRWITVGPAGRPGTSSVTATRSWNLEAGRTILPQPVSRTRIRR